MNDYIHVWIEKKYDTTLLAFFSPNFFQILLIHAIIRRAMIVKWALSTCVRTNLLVVEIGGSLVLCAIS